MSTVKQTARPEVIIPCAGLSSRMGDWKPMLAYRGSTIVEHAVRNALAVCRRVLLVTGYRSTELEALFATNARVRCVRNEEYERGMFSSIRRAAAELEAGRFFVAMGDMPEIPPRLYLRLLREPPAEVLRPRYRGVPAHPVLFSAKAVPIIRSLPPEASMAQVLAALKVREIETEEPGSIKDIDTREEYDPSGKSL